MVSTPFPDMPHTKANHNAVGEYNILLCSCKNLLQNLKQTRRKYESVFPEIPEISFK
jgi:hypothetical protein